MSGEAIFVLIFAAAAALGFGPSALIWALQRYKRHLQSRIDTLKAQALLRMNTGGLTPSSSPTETDAPKLTLSPAPAAKAKWHAMPCGTRLELAGTGFYIALEPQNKMQPYTSYSPEGVEIACASGLAILKALSEIRADERAEFAPIKTWTPPK